MFTKMDKQSWKEEMMEAKEAEKEYINMADVANIPGEVEKAVKNGTGKDITRLAEEKPKRKYTRRAKNHDTDAPAWQRHIKDCIALMLAESIEKSERAKELLEEAQGLADRAAALEDMIK